LGFFNVNDLEGPCKCDLPDGEYYDLITNQTIVITNREISMAQIPAIILKIPSNISLNRLDSSWLGLI
jgi:hypothetical protein